MLFTSFRPFAKLHGFMLLWAVTLFVGRGFASAALEFDEAEQILHAQYLGMGYATQPPMFEWLLQLWGVWFGGVGLWSLLTLKLALMLITYAAIYQALKRWLQSPSLAAVLAMSVFVLPQMMWEIPRTLTHTLLATALLAVMAEVLLRTFMKKTHEPRDWLVHAWLSVLIAGVVLSKYNAVVVLLLGLMSVLVYLPARQRLMESLRQNWRFWCLTAAVAVLLVLPHVVWLGLNWQLATAPIFQRLGVEESLTWSERTLQGLSGFAVGLLSFYSTLLVLPAIALYKRLKNRQEFNIPLPQKHAHLVHLTNIYMVFFLLFCLSLVTFMGTHAFRDRWLTPFLFWTPMVVVWGLSRFDASLKWFTRVAQALLLVLGVLFVIRAPLLGALNKPGWLNVPAEVLAQKLDQDFSIGARVIASNIQLAGDIRLHSKDRSVIFPAYSVYARQNAQPACELLMVSGDFEGKSLSGDETWTPDMLHVVADQWSLSTQETLSWVETHRATERQYAIPALYSDQTFQVRALLLKSPHSNHCAY